MSGGMYIKQAIIAALCEHPDQDKYRTRAFSGDHLDQVVDAMSREAHKLTKSDFFQLDDEGKPLINTAGFWKNFDKILDIIHANGEKFTFEDFTKSLDRKDPNNTLLASAAAKGGLGKIFTAPVWEGRFDEMERLWYRVPMPDRKALFRNNGLLDPDFKRLMLKAEGRSCPEDRLAASSLTPADLRAAFEQRGTFEEVKRKLEVNGDYFRKEYLMLPDNEGDTVFWHKGTWDRYEELTEGMKKHGERFEVADFIRQISDRHNILGRAAEKDALPKVFAASQWEGRLADMVELWGFVRDGWSTSITPRDFDMSYAQAESATYAAKINMAKIESKAALLQPVDTPAGASPVLPLGMKAVWDDIDNITARLSQRGETITIADLRHKSGHLNQSCLISAAKYGHFARIVDMAKAGGEMLTMDDFLSRDRHGVSLIKILAERNELKLVFTPDLWAGRVNDMKLLWSHVHTGDQKQVDIHQVEVAAKQAGLKQKAKGKFKL